MFSSKHSLFIFLVQHSHLPLCACRPEMSKLHKKQFHTNQICRPISSLGLQARTVSFVLSLHAEFWPSCFPSLASLWTRWRPIRRSGVFQPRRLRNSRINSHNAPFLRFLSYGTGRSIVKGQGKAGETVEGSP